MIRGTRVPVPAAATLLVVAVLTAIGGTAALAKPGPNTIIDSGPANPTSSTSATFTFHATVSGATFSCRVDGGAGTPCTSPTTYSGLTEAPHSFSVAATAGGVTDASPATSSWTVDTTAPAAPTGLTATTPTTTSVALAWTAGTDSSGIKENDIYRDGSKLTTVGAVTSWTDSSLTAGSTHTYTVRARDNAGNTSIDSGAVTATTPATNAAPDTVIDSGPPQVTNSNKATFTFHATVPGATFRCQLDSGGPTTCQSPFTYKSLTQTSHTFTVTATVNGQADPTPATATWIVDKTAPTVPTGLTATGSATSISLAWTASTDNTAVAGYDIFRDGTQLGSVGVETTYTDTAVTPGATYTYAVRAIDTAGNVSALGASVSAIVAAPLDPHLTRPPYLTDLVGLDATVNFATDRSQTVASVMYGAVDSSGSCTPSTSVDATKITVAVGSIFEYQWKARLNLPSAGTYCYRPFLGSTDLLGGNTPPQFRTQVPAGSTQPFSFAVFGDWGQAYAPPGNTNQTNLLDVLSKSGVRFALTTGDNSYPSGSQLNYGDLQQSGADISAVFGPKQWGVPGASIALFPAIGNHGLARSDAIHPHFGIWPQDRAVATSNGSYENVAYPSVNGSTPATYPSPWYAFDAGNARFYVLDAAWADLNTGTASAYENEADSHWSTTSAEYTWLEHDLSTHPSGLKFAFFHYPLYSDQPDEASDPFLQGATGLEGLLARYGVNIAFQGHAHIYQRSTGLDGLVSYVTGGGGAKAQSTGACSTNDHYAIGWSYTRARGTTCGSAPVPTSDAQVYHFLKVTVNGTQVTVTPTDSTGRTFDVQTYNFQAKPDTTIDSSPPAGTSSSTATFTFHSSITPATFACRLDAAPSAPCTSPVTYAGLAEGSHTFTVTATAGGVADPDPASVTWTVDSTPPDTPAAVTATSTSPFEVDVSWSAAADNTGVTGYDLFRDGSLYKSLGVVTTYTDTDVLGSTTYEYAVRARDIAGNLSTLSQPTSVTTPSAPLPIFSDGFESGTLSAWSSSAGLVPQGTVVHTGSTAVEGNTTNGGTYAKKTFSSTYPNAWARVWFNVVAQPDQVNLLRLRDGAGNSIGYAYIETTGQLGVHDDVTGATALSSTRPGPGWHALELHLEVGSAPGALGAREVWLDNARVDDISSLAVDVGSAPVGGMQIGEVQTGRTYDVVFDDAAFATSRLGPADDTTPPTVPTGLTATPAAFSVDLGWTRSTDAGSGVASYDVLRNGTLVGTVPDPLTTYTDGSVQPSTTYQYMVAARDQAGNVSAPSEALMVTTPAAATPLFSDGFETGDLSAWTSTAGLTVQSTDTRTGTFAAEGNSPTGVTWAKKTVASCPCPDAYARVAFLVKSQGSQSTLLRLRNTPTGLGGYVYLTAGGRLGFHNDALNTSTNSTVSPGSGWHVLELHIKVDSAPDLGVVEVWLDGAPVPALSNASVEMGTAPMAVLQIGDTAGAGTGTGWDLVYDDAALSTTRVGT